jgi:hypothetical protein
MIGFTFTTGGETLPVELSSLTAIVTPLNTVQINWVTQSETNVSGYYVLRNTSANDATASVVSPLIAGTNTSTQTSYSFIDQNNPESGLLFYWLKCVDLAGTYTVHGPISIYLETSPNTPPPPVAFGTSLQRVYPNPFNPTTTIDFTIAKPSTVRIEIYNLRGENLRRLGNQFYAKGTYECVWDGKAENGEVQASGIYFIKLSTPDHVSARKVLMLK